MAAKDEHANDRDDNAKKYLEAHLFCRGVCAFDEDRGYCLLLRVRDPNSDRHVDIKVPFKRLGKLYEFVLEPLLDKGIVLDVPPKYIQRAILDFMVGQQKYPRHTLVSNSGFHQDKSSGGLVFVKPPYTVSRADSGNPASAVNDRFIFDEECADAKFINSTNCAITFDVIDFNLTVQDMLPASARRTVNLICKSPLHLTMLLISLAAPFLTAVGCQTTFFNFYGSSSRGKSVGLASAGWVYGKSSVPGRNTGENLIRNWHSTQAGIEAVLQSHSGICVFLDELGIIGEGLTNAYMYGSGEGRTRMGEDGKNRKTAIWSLIGLSTGELSTGELLERNRGAPPNQGEMVRFIDIPISVFDQFSDMDDLQRKELVDEIEKSIRNDAGILAVYVMAKLLNGPDALTLEGLKSRLMERKDDLRALFIEDAERSGTLLSQPHKRVADIFSVLLEVACQLNLLGCFPADVNDDKFLQTLSAMYCAWARLSPMRNSVDAIREKLINFGSTCYSSLLTDQGERPYSDIKGYLVDKYLALTKPQLEGALQCSLGEDVLNQLREAGLLHTNESGRFTRKFTAKEKRILERSGCIIPDRAYFFNVGRVRESALDDTDLVLE